MLRLENQYDTDNSIYWNKKEVSSALGTIEPQENNFLLHLTNILNSYNGLDNTKDYYNFLCGDWLMHFTHVVYAAYLEVIRGGRVSSSHRPLFVFPDYSSFIKAVQVDPIFKEQLHQRIAELLENSSSQDFQFAMEACSVGTRQSNVKNRIRYSLTGAGNYLSKLGRQNSPLVLCRPSYKCHSMEWRRALWKWRKWARQDNFDYPVEVTTEIDVDWRRRKSEEITISDFTDIICALMPLYVPVLYLEALLGYRDKSHKLNLNRPKAIYTTNSLYGHSLFKVLAADWRQDGTKILNHQHGGGYGLDKVHKLEDYESSIVDRFYSWGWKKEENPSIRPLSYPYSIMNRVGPGKILLMCGSYPPNVYRFHFHPMPGTISTMMSNTIAFLSKLPVKSDLLIRLSKANDGLNQKPLLQVAATWSDFDEKHPNIIERYAESRLVVHNYLGTSWLETLNMNIPTVCFYDPDTFCFNKDGQPYIDDLAAAGILHQNGVEAAKFVVDVMDDPQAWWQEAKVQEARMKFVGQYANFSDNWVNQWEDEFQQFTG